MTFLEKIEMIQRVDQLIRMKATGSARKLSKRLGISKSSIYTLLECMRQMGAEIEYCECKKSYYYTIEKELSIGFVAPSKIYGGKYFKNNFHCPVFLDNNRLYLFSSKSQFNI